MDSLKNLNETFFSLYGRLYENKKFLTKRQLNVMSNELFEQYKIEAKKTLLPKLIDDKFKLFDIKQRKQHRVPFKFLFFSNKLARLVCKSIKEELAEYYKSFNRETPTPAEKSNEVGK